MTGDDHARTRNGEGRRLHRPRRCRSHYERRRPKWVVPEPPVYGPSILDAVFEVEYFKTKLFEILKIPQDYIEFRPKDAEITRRLMESTL